MCILDCVKDAACRLLLLLLLLLLLEYDCDVLLVVVADCVRAVVVAVDVVVPTATGTVIAAMGPPLGHPLTRVQVVLFNNVRTSLGLSNVG
jgi:hypothetical protein